MDRRVSRTRKRLQHALMVLSSDHAYDAIGVEDICRAAGVARSTFYKHYVDKDDLKRASIEAICRAPDSTTMATEEGGARLGFSLPLLKHVAECRRQYLAIDGTVGGALPTVRQTVMKEMRNVVRAFPAIGAPEREFAAQYLTGAFMTVLAWWVERGNPETPQDIDRLFQSMSISALSVR